MHAKLAGAYKDSVRCGWCIRVNSGIWWGRVQQYLPGKIHSVFNLCSLRSDQDRQQGRFVICRLASECIRPSGRAWRRLPRLPINRKQRIEAFVRRGVRLGLHDEGHTSPILMSLRTLTIVYSRESCAAKITCWNGFLSYAKNCRYNLRPPRHHFVLAAKIWRLEFYNKAVLLLTFIELPFTVLLSNWLNFIQSLLLLWPPYVIGGPLYFCPVISIFFFFYLFFLA